MIALILKEHIGCFVLVSIFVNLTDIILMYREVIALTEVK